jgi:hypothetical protein
VIVRLSVLYQNPAGLSAAALVAADAAESNAAAPVITSNRADIRRKHRDRADSTFL